MGVRLALLPKIKQFLHDYRELCPQSTVFSELHYLEGRHVEHGSMGEHGGEIIYHLFNLLRNRFSSIPEAESRSYHTLEEHHQTVYPDCPSAPEQSRKKAKKGLKEVSLDLMILHGLTVFNFSSEKKNDDGPGLKIW